MNSVPETKQIRFAVVMYGGGSLAIYINGIAQELFKMVRATAADIRPEELQDTGKVYRQLALLLSDRELLKSVARLKSKNQMRVVLEALSNKNRDDFKKSLEDEQPKLYREFVENSRRRIAPAAKDDAYELFETTLEKALKAGRPQVRFIVDVITGSSAGGINGVFLAKALVNNQPMDDLKKLWLEEGDFSVLLNDKKSVAGTNLPGRFEPESLLNSRRMYAKLLAALDGMDKSRQAAAASPNVAGELDLFVTVTDYTGVRVPIRLFDRIVSERRHKQFFHFNYRRKKSSVGDLEVHDFGKSHNPFLAFAARATSAFPLAFEPMRLSDIDEVIARCAADHGAGNSACADWKKFFKNFDFVKDDEVAQRAFLDGGALDNKPFGFAVETLLKRQADVPVDRKLIYIEPSPETFDPNGDVLVKPDAIENLIAQGSTLPRYETIREDLQNLLERNRFVTRVNKLIKETERNVYESYNDSDIRTEMYESEQSKAKSNNLSRTAPGEEWERHGFKEIVEFKGRGVLPYYQLRKIYLTDNLARLVTESFGFTENSDYFLAIRALVNNWREREFHDVRQNGGRTTNYFLRHFDLEYRLRRLRFVLRKVEKFRTLEAELAGQLEEVWKKEAIRLAEDDEKSDNSEKEKTPEELEKEKKSKAAEKEFNEREKIEIEMADGQRRYLFPGAAIWYLCHEKNSPADGHEKLSEATTRIQGELIRVFDNLRFNAERLTASSPAEAKALKEEETSEPCREFFQDLKKLSLRIENKDLEYILGKRHNGGEAVCSDFNEDVCNVRAGQYLEGDEGQAVYDLLQTAAGHLDEYLSRVFSESSAAVERALKPTGDESDDFERAIRKYLWHYYDNFDDYDQISFPIYYQTNIGEADVVDIIRISPQDAKSLIDEENPRERRRKLAGNSLYGFGAFLDVAWRQNDIMWGRLDGVERLIAALLADEEKHTGDGDYARLREVLIEEAQQSILGEEFLKHNKDALAVRYADILLKLSAGLDIDQAIRQTNGDVYNAGGDQLQSLINACVGDARIREILAARLEEQWKKRGKVFPSAVVAALDDNEIRKVLGEHFKTKEVSRTVAALVDRSSNQYLRSSVQACLSKDDALGFMQSYYQVSRRLEPQPLLRVISRSTQVIGRLLENVSEKHGVENRQLQWLARLGGIFWGIVEVAAPNSLLNLLFRHWLKLLYFFEALLIVGGTLLVESGIQQTGIIALIATLAVHVAVLFLEDTMRGRNFWRDILKYLAAATLVILSISGAVFLLSFLLVDDLWMNLNKIRDFLNAPERQWLRKLSGVLIGLAVIAILVRQAIKEKRGNLSDRA